MAQDILRNYSIMKPPMATRYRQTVQKRYLDRISTRYAKMIKRIDHLEAEAHPPIPMECFDGYREIEARLTRLERYIFQKKED
tara:strand:- start:810 stop:1058 length:249 start_codon:yes stop_codon:yes gene_type:complete